MMPLTSQGRSLHFLHILKYDSKKILFILQHNCCSNHIWVATKYMGPIFVTFYDPLEYSLAIHRHSGTGKIKFLLLPLTGL